MDTAPIKTAKRSWPRRIGRIVVRLVAGVLLLLVLVLAFFHTSWGKSVVRGRIESRLGAMVNGEVTLGSLDYGFMFGSIELGDIEIKDASGKPAIKVGSIKVDLERKSLLDGTPRLDLAIAGVDVNLVRNADGTSNLTGLFKPSDRKPMKQITIGKLAVTGGAKITKPDGSTIAIKDLAVGGTLDARPVDKWVAAAIQHVGAQVEITDQTGTKHVAVKLDDIKVNRGLDGIEADIAKVALGALTIDKVGAKVKLEDGKPRGEQKISLGKTRVDHKELAKLYGKDLLVDDVALDLSITGPENKLVIGGTIKSGGSNLAITGTADLSTPVPGYAITIAGKGRTTEILKPQPDKKLLDVTTDATIVITGSGTSPLDLDTEIRVTAGTTQIGKITVDSLVAKARATRGAYKIESLVAKAVELEVDATADIAADKSLTGKVRITGSPAKAMKALAAAGIAIPQKAPAIDKLDVVVHAKGTLDGELEVDIDPTKIPLAGGIVGLSGKATLDNKQLRIAKAKVDLGGLDLASLSLLAGRPPKVAGSISGTLDITKTQTTRDIDYNVAIALRDKPLTIAARGQVGASSVTARADVLRRAAGGGNDRSVLAKLDARLPLDAAGFQPAGSWKLAIDVANRQLADLVPLLPEHLREKIPAGAVEIHAALAGSPMRPTGTITIDANAAALKAVPGMQKIALVATLVPTAGGLSVKTTGSASLEGLDKLVTIDGTIAMPYRWIANKPDVAALRAGLAVDANVDIPERPLAALAVLRAKLADFGGTVGGRIGVKGPPKAIVLDAKIDWKGYQTAANTTGITEITAKGTPKVLTVTVTHNQALGIIADIDRSNADRTAVHARITAKNAPLLPLLPAMLAAKLPTSDIGTLSSTLDARVVLAKTEAGTVIDQLALAGGLDVAGGSIAIPGSTRRYKDITLAIAGEPSGIAIKKLSLRESDIQNANRAIDISGMVALDKAKPTTAQLALAARDWLVFGGDRFGMADAPRASASFDIAVAADLTQPILGIDATVHSLALRSPDRGERAHFVEKISVGGDVIFVDANTTVGKLPVAAPVVAGEARKKRPMNIRVRIPKAIRLEQTPMDLMAKGDITVAIREDRTDIRGALAIESGKLYLFGRDHELASGSLTFDEQHPTGNMALTFEYPLPDVVVRELSSKQGGPRVSFSGPPSKPKTTLHGAANAAMFEVMALYNAGRPTTVSRPGLPAATTVQTPRGDQWFMLTFLATNLPHLLFLDRVNAWADPYQAANAYGRITNMEGEKYNAANTRRVKAVVRPNQPGRSRTELQVDRVFVNSNRAAAGVGLRAGDRLGGGVGLFLEWSSR